MGKLIRLRGTTIARPADATAYAAGDEISNSASAGSVVRAVFDLSGFTRGRILTAGIDITVPAGTVVTTASDMELMLFKASDVPAAVGDNVTNPIQAATRSLAAGIFRFDDTGWTDTLGGATATISQYQEVGAHMVQPLAANVLQSPWYPGYAFDFSGQSLANRSLSVVLRALAAWTPLAVVNTIGLTLSIETD